MKKLAINPSNKRYYSDKYIKGWEDGVKAQYEATIDAVEVVRCKDCRFSEIFQNDSSGVMAMYCRAFTFERMIAEDDYCSYGERREDGDA